MAFLKIFYSHQNNKNWQTGCFGINGLDCSSPGKYSFVYGFLFIIIVGFRSATELILNSRSLLLPNYRFEIERVSTLNEKCSFYFRPRK